MQLRGTAAFYSYKQSGRPEPWKGGFSLYNFRGSVLSSLTPHIQVGHYSTKNMMKRANQGLEPSPSDLPRSCPSVTLFCQINSSS